MTLQEVEKKLEKFDAFEYYSKVDGKTYIVEKTPKGGFSITKKEAVHER